MDINSLINTQSLATNRLAENALNLKVGQRLDVKVIGADIQAAKNAITLTLGNKDISVQSNQPITLRPGQDLKIQVTQIAPSIEFKIIDPLKPQDPTQLRLKLIATAMEGRSAANGKEPMRPTAMEGGSAANGKEPMRPTAMEGGNAASDMTARMQNNWDAGGGATKGLMQTTVMNGKNAASGKEPMGVTQANGNAAIGEKPDSASSPLQARQPIDAKIISIIGSKIQLQLLSPSIAETGNKQAGLITIDRTQLTNAISDLKVGQNLSLEIVKAGTTPEFKIIPASINIPEAKVTEFIKQFLPRHEAPPLLLNQLIKDLPQLMKNESVPQALKDIAAKIIQNLPPKEQLITSQGLKQAIINSGLFLEAKLSPAMAQELPQLIKNESVPQSLQRIAAEILQNLTQKEASVINSPDGGTDTKQRLDKLPNPAKANPLTEAADAGVKNAIQGASIEDFKANLLKFIHALKQELGQQGAQQHNQVDLDLLKNLQNKTENTIAKLALDQLMSLPKDDNPKQQWIIDIPFIDRHQAETVKIEIQQDKERKQQSGGSDWSVNITITPPELGTIHCMVSYRDDRINTFFKSRNVQTTELIKHNLDYLKNQLEESGLTTGHMDAHADSQKTQAPHQLELGGKKLFDDRA
jgi:uncharacterized protein (UPF0147 family)